MFEVGFSEILVIFVLALVVLGPEKLPRVASQVGRWIGRARGMARQFREQLEEEVNLEQARKLQPPVAASPPEPPPPITQIPSTPPAQAEQQVSYPDTYSHAHPTDFEGRPVETSALETPGAPRYETPPEARRDEAGEPDSPQHDWVGGLTGADKSTQGAADAAYAPSNERGT
ncbi:MAG: Sec-independent protein translocase protein TatB [Steroidobacteraceae bacterium]